MRLEERSRNALIKSLRKRGEKEKLAQVGLQLPGSSWQLVFPWWVVVQFVRILISIVRCAQIKISFSDLVFYFSFHFDSFAPRLWLKLIVILLLVIDKQLIPNLYIIIYD